MTLAEQILARDPFQRVAWYDRNDPEQIEHAFKVAARQYAAESPHLQSWQQCGNKLPICYR